MRKNFGYSSDEWILRNLDKVEKTDKIMVMIEDLQVEEGKKD